MIPEAMFIWKRCSLLSNRILDFTTINSISNKRYKCFLKTIKANFLKKLRLDDNNWRLILDYIWRYELIERGNMLDRRTENISYEFDFLYFINLSYGKIKSIFMLVSSFLYFLAPFSFKSLFEKKLPPSPKKLQPAVSLSGR